jgi:hypothetical protein
MTDFTILTDKALRDELLTREESLAVLHTEDSRLLELLQAAFRVRERYFGKTVRLQMLLLFAIRRLDGSDRPVRAAASGSDANRRSPRRGCQSSTVLHRHQRPKSLGS